MGKGMTENRGKLRVPHIVHWEEMADMFRGNITPSDIDGLHAAGGDHPDSENIYMVESRGRLIFFEFKTVLSAPRRTGQSRSLDELCRHRLLPETDAVFWVSHNAPDDPVRVDIYRRHIQGWSVWCGGDKAQVGKGVGAEEMKVWLLWWESNGNPEPIFA